MAKTVEINVMQRSDKSMYFEVNVRGVLKPNSIMQGILEQGKHTKECLAIMVLAAALAEELIASVGDTMLDPDMVAQTAEQCYRELMAENPHIKLGTELPRYADSTGGVVPN